MLITLAKDKVLQSSLVIFVYITDIGLIVNYFFFRHRPSLLLQLHSCPHNLPLVREPFLELDFLEAVLGLFFFLIFSMVIVLYSYFKPNLLC